MYIYNTQDGTGQLIMAKHNCAMTEEGVHTIGDDISINTKCPQCSQNK